jgi:hypothetical protein
MAIIFPVRVPVPPDLLAVIRADLRFFERRPKRRHRLRLAAECEIEEGRRKLGLILPPPDVRVFCGIQRLSPRNVHRVIGFAIDVGEADFDEKTAKRAYTRLNPQDVTARPVGADLWQAVPARAAIGG